MRFYYYNWSILRRDVSSLFRCFHFQSIKARFNVDYDGRFRILKLKLLFCEFIFLTSRVANGCLSIGN